ncbi:MAG: T9SS type A sorting domain-containing protein [Saprospiraceae bacterium]
MKYLLFLILLVNTVTYSQAKLEVNMHDACGEINDFTAQIQLYEGSNFIAQSNLAHHTFEGLNPNGSYTIKVKATPINTDINSVKDALLIRDHILGFRQLNNYGKLASDFNQDGKTTASDIVNLEKILLGIITDTFKNESFIVETQSLTLPVPYPITKGEYIFNGIKDNHQTLDLTVLQLGLVAKASGFYCNGQCADINDKFGQLLFDDVDVKKGQDVNVQLYLKNEFNYQGLDFTFNISAAEIVKIMQPNFQYNRNQNRIHAIWLNQDFSSTIPARKTVFNLTIQPERDGKLSEFIIFEANNPKNEAVIRDGLCIRSIKQLVMIPSTNFSQQCDIVWPQDITISKCSDHAGEPLISQLCQNAISINYFDTHIEQCKKIDRNWELLNWVSGEIFKHTQHITVDENFDHVCQQKLIVNFSELNTNIKATQLVVNPKSDHHYSFTTLTQDSIKSISYEYPHNFQIEVYDLTASKVCIAGLEKKFVELDSFVVLSHIIKRQVNGIYKVSATDFSWNGTNLPSNISDLLISSAGGSYTTEYIFDKSVVGKTADFALKYTKNGTIINHGVVTAYFEPNTFVENVDPLQLYAYNDYLVSGKEYNIDIYSTNFQKMLSFQYGAKLKNAKLKSVKNGALMVNNSYSYMTDQDLLRMLWYDEATIPKSFDQNTVLFTLTIVPVESGFLADFIALDDNILFAEAVFESSALSGKIHLEFGFKARTTIVENQSNNNEFEIFPNPLIDNILNIKWPNDFKPSNLTISDASGHIMLQKAESDLSHHPMTIQVPESWPKGIYFITLSNNLRILSKKIAITE